MHVKNFRGMLNRSDDVESKGECVFPGNNNRLLDDKVWCISFCLF